MNIDPGSSKYYLMKNKFLLPVLFLLSITSLHAQYNIKQNNVWAFGYHAGLDFNTGSPVAVQTGIEGLYLGSTGPNAYFIEGSASVCDSNGHLLFYGTADSIWDKNGHRWPNGYSLMPHKNSLGNDTSYEGASTDEGLLIVPVIGNPNQYYLFCLEDASDLENWGDMHASRLYYSIADMTLNGGLGDIVTTKKGIKIDSMLSEKMIAIAGNSCDIWVLVHSMDSAVFRAYHVTGSGIDTAHPVISHAGYFDSTAAYNTGVIKVSPDRSKIVVCNHLEKTGIELCSFDPNTGTVSNALLIDSANRTYGASFSPDNSKLYVKRWDASYNMLTSQYNVGLSTAIAIINSRVTVDSEAGGGYDTDLRLGPDGKIYCDGFTSTRDSMDCIKFPNLAGTSCQYTKNVVALVSGSNAYHAMPATEFVKPLNCVLSVPEMGENEQTISLYPNPNGGNFILKGRVAKGNEAVIEIINSLGQSVYKETFITTDNVLNKQLSLGNSMPPGVYFLRLTASGEYKTISFLIGY